MEWLGYAKIGFTHAKQPRIVHDKQGAKTDLLKIAEKTTPPCALNPFLLNGHMQTLWSATKPVGPKIYYKRKIFESAHETFVGTFAVDFVVDEYEGEDATLFRRTTYFNEEEFKQFESDDEKPMAIIMHGVAGGSHEVYLRHAIAPLVEAGWEACVINSRGCAKSELTSHFLYNGRATWDIRQLAKWLKGRFPNRPLYGIGFSLGGNMLTNFCGEEGENCLLSGAVVCSNPYNLELSNTLLSNQYLGKNYLNIVKDALVAYVKKHRKILEEHLDIEAITKVKTMEEFDRLVECQIWGYPTESAYYRDASSSDSVLAIRIPFLAIHALDDPVAPKEAVPWQEFKQNPNTVLLTTSMGGHISWYESGGGRWFPKAIAGFLNHLAFQTEPESLGAVSYIKDDKDTKNMEYVGTRRKMLIEQY
ncbi:unnamed protein product [Clonostachys rosea]|uniref:AB hydrolase-1 domain-containing protein n=1 Tax=Bionectria ochroleuca TaxID=29856 RepID=A0ABY6U6W4_BIOOC|nr:unnamed protein product [Clonostachys rosea]